MPKVVIIDDLGLVLSYGSKRIIRRVKADEFAREVTELLTNQAEVRAKVRDPSTYRVLIKLLGIEPAWLDGQPISRTDRVFVVIPKEPPNEIEFYEVVR